MYLEKLAVIIKREDLNVFDAAEYFDGEIANMKFKNIYAETNIFSISKSFIATAIGILADEKLINLDDRVIGYFKDELPINIDEKFQDTTIFHLLTHQTGLEKGYLFESDVAILEEEDFLTKVLSLPLQYAPGTKAVYTNTGYYLLSVIIEKITKKKTHDFLNEKIFLPLNFKFQSWWECPLGHTFGASGLHITLLDMLKFGLLYLNQGVMEGIRYLSKNWCSNATKVQANINNQGYSLSFWHTSKKGIFYCSGAWGQIILIDTINNCVLAFRSYDGFAQSKLIEELLRK